MDIFMNHQKFCWEAQKMIDMAEKTNPKLSQSLLNEAATKLEELAQKCRNKANEQNDREGYPVPATKA